MLEALEDRVTPSSAVMPPAFVSGASNSALVAAPSNSVNFNFTPSRIIAVQGASSVNFTVNLTNSSGAAVTGGSVSFNLKDERGGTIGSVQAGDVSLNGQITMTYNLPANLPPGAYSIIATYNNPGAPNDGASGTAILDIVLGPIPAQTSPSTKPAAAAPDLQPPSTVFLPPATTFPVSPSAGTTPALSLFQAAFTLYVDGVEKVIDTVRHQPTDGVQASINAAMPFAGPWGQLFELAGEMAASQIVMDAELSS